MKYFVIFALSLTSLSAFAEPGVNCHDAIEAHLKGKFADSFYQRVGRGSKKRIIPLRNVSIISCKEVSNKRIDCEASTSACLDENGEEVGGGDQVYTVGITPTCRVLYSALTAEE